MPITSCIRRALFGLSLSAMALASQASDNTAAQAAVAKQIEALNQAMISGNAQQLKQLAAEQLSYGHSSGTIENKAQFVEQIASGRSDFVSIELKNQHISVTGDTAIVRHELFADINDGGTPNSIHLGILLVWQLQDSQWKLLARQAFKLPTTAAQ